MIDPQPSDPATKPGPEAQPEPKRVSQVTPIVVAVLAVLMLIFYVLSHLIDDGAGPKEKVPMAKAEAAASR